MSPETTDQALFLTSAVALALAVIGTVAAVIAGRPPLGELLVPGALLGLLAVTLGVIAGRRPLIVAGAAAALAAPAAWLLVEQAGVLG